MTNQQKQKRYEYMEREHTGLESLARRSESLEASVFVRATEEEFINEAEVLGRLLLAGLGSHENIRLLIQKVERLIVLTESIERRLEALERAVAEAKLGIEHTHKSIDRFDRTLFRIWENAQNLRKEWEEYLDAQTDPRQEVAAAAEASHPRIRKQTREIRERMLYEAESLIKAGDVLGKEISLKMITERLGIPYHVGAYAWGSAKEFRREVARRFGSEGRDK